MNISEFCENIAGSGKILGNDQRRNLKGLLEVSEKFHRDAKIPYKDNRIDKKILVIETGHQPLFLPYSGIWKKAFLAEFIEKELRNSDESSIAFFGFLDYDISSSKLLFQNRIPKMNKYGFLNIGLRRPNDSEIWKRFNELDKPSEEKWEKVVKDISRNYLSNIDVEEIVEELWISYDLSDNFADLNAISFARICRLIGLNIRFFRSSDVQNKKLFGKVWKEIIENVEAFNFFQNSAAENLNFSDLKASKNALPFWYHCECGGKVSIERKDNGFIGECNLCRKKVELEDLHEELENLSPKAIMRNVLFFEGMGTSVFITGSGGSLKYGLISNEISENFGFNIPKTIFWESMDVYLGKEHEAAVNSISKEFRLSEKDLWEKHVILNKVESRRRQIAAKINGTSDRKVRKKYLSQYKRTSSIISSASSVFTLKPSIVDVAANVGLNKLKTAWEVSLVKDGRITKNEIGEFYKVESVVFYDSPEILNIYRVFWDLEKENRRIDPLGILE
ncbi:hypothetical protein Ferp_1923 [Ferroglobus placidus DSM 10642]|uniref:Uncharacterized protein n=2 Tax=Ferroglobus placidus TaxID=54261 RepID=D3RZZ9_FERPA|nr:hypothetical protein Ferp_1923 [Ferroglobus placidus DSM 10642]